MAAEGPPPTSRSSPWNPACASHGRGDLANVPKGGFGVGLLRDHLAGATLSRRLCGKDTGDPITDGQTEEVTWRKQREPKTLCIVA